MSGRAGEPVAQPIEGQSVTEIMIVPTIVITESPPCSSTTTPQQAISGQRASRCSVGMQLTVHVAHNGVKLKADSRVVST